MTDENSTDKKRSPPSASEFMRARRPELYSDTVKTNESSMDRRQFEFHLDTLTTRKEETLFEHFSRALAEKELCPNLLPQTGPTGGGDSKVDTETYPVADEIADRWYEGAGRQGSVERWAFAISAKKKWRPKVQSDVGKIVGTGRPYSLIYFITNQAVPDKARSEVEDALRLESGIDIRILDRTWIVDKVTTNQRWSIVEQTLGLRLSQTEIVATPGPLDAERLRDLQELDRQLEDIERYKGAGDQLADDSLRTAILARGLGRSRVEVDGRFDRALRFALEQNNQRQSRRVLYQRAWTALWWFDDYAEADRIYDELAPDLLSADWVWELDDLVNLWAAAAVRRTSIDSPEITQLWSTRTASLREALQRHSADSSRATSSLWARSQLLLMDLTHAAKHREKLPSVFRGIKRVLENARDHIEFPARGLIRLVREFGRIVTDDSLFDELLELAMTLQRDRTGTADEGIMRLERGREKLQTGKPYDAIDQFAKAQSLLAQEEHRENFIAALASTALAYESAGLLWAARANFVVALDRCLYTYFKSGRVDARALTLIRKLVWVDMQLGRVPYVLCWMEWLRTIQAVVQLPDSQRKLLQEEVETIDRVLGILILRTSRLEWLQLGRMTSVFESYSLLMSSAAALYMLGQEEHLSTESEIPRTDFQDFFSSWLQQPAANDLPLAAEWYLESSSAMHTVLLGCKLTLISRGGGTTVLLAESLLAFLESFFSTTISLEGFLSPRSDLTIEVRQSDQAKLPFSIRIIEDDCGESGIVVVHPPNTAAQIVSSDGYEKAMLTFFTSVLGEMQLNISKKTMEPLFAKHRAQDRAFVAARSVLSIENVLGFSPKYRATDWNASATGESLAQLRTVDWVPTAADASVSDAVDEPPFKLSEGKTPTHLIGVDALKHRDMNVMSPIYLPLWDKARWSGTGVLIHPPELELPHLVLTFADIDAGRKIFLGWRKRIGALDVNGWIGLTIITGIDREFPAHYRIAIGVSRDYLQRQSKSGSRFVMTHRMNDMTPQNNSNLNRFLEEFASAKRFKLHPCVTNVVDLSSFLQHSNLAIEMTRLTVVPAWKIESTDPIISALRGIKDPYIPPDVVNAPILRTLERLKSFGKNKKS